MECDQCKELLEILKLIDEENLDTGYKYQIKQAIEKAERGSL